VQGTNTNSKHKLQPVIVNLMLLSHVHYCDDHDDDWRGHVHSRWHSACSSVSTTNSLIYFFVKPLRQLAYRWRQRETLAVQDR